MHQAGGLEIAFAFALTFDVDWVDIYVHGIGIELRAIAQPVLHLIDFQLMRIIKPQ